MACKAVLQTFANSPRDGPLLDADWRCRVCSKLPAEHPAEPLDLGPAAQFGQKLDAGIHDLRKIGHLFRKTSSGKAHTTVIHVRKPEEDTKKAVREPETSKKEVVTGAPAKSETATSAKREIEPTKPETVKKDTQELTKKDSAKKDDSHGKRDAETNARKETEATAAKEKEASSNVKLNKFMKMLQEPNMDMEALRSASWSGIPFEVRATVWQLLLGYLPANRARRRDTLERRRAEYHGYVRQFYDIPESSRSDEESKILRQIEKDVPRTGPGIKWIQDPKMQKSLERMLYIWAIRHPASGYVQGINDLATPFYLVFLSTSAGKPVGSDFEEVVESLPSMTDLEADCFWCLSMLLDGIQDHYTFAQPGIQRMVYKLEELVQRVDVQLHEHFKKHNLQFFQFAFRWMNCLLMREISLPLVVRLWDTYLSEPNQDGFKNFHIYACAALLCQFGKQLKQLDFQDLVLLLQSLPTQEWGVKEIELILSQAFVLQSQYQNSPAQLK